MEILKLRNSIILLLCIWINQSILGQEIVPKINLESVRKDVISHGDYMFPEEYIKNIVQDKFNVIYFDNFCLVHIAYKNTDISSSEKFSQIVVYTFKGKTWTYQNSIPYYYNLKLLNAKKKIFFSDNLFCSMNGSCDHYIEISSFNGTDLIPLIKYEGFDSTLYYDRLLTFEEKDKVLDEIGDTIGNDISLSNILINEKGLKSFNLDRKVIILKNVLDTLQTNVIKTNKQVIYSSQ